VFKQLNLPIATDFPLFSTNLDYVVAFSTPDSRLLTRPSTGHSLSPTLGNALRIPGPTALVHVLSLSIPASPHSIHRGENPSTTPHPASLQSHHTVKNPTIDSYGYINKDHSFSRTTLQDPPIPIIITQWSSFVIVYYTITSPLSHPSLRFYSQIYE
jgi:hypothetical protein